MKKKMMILNQRENEKRGYIPDQMEVEVLAIVGVNAMVRRKGAMPFVVSTKQLSEKEPHQER